LVIGGVGQGIAFTGLFIAGTGELPGHQHGIGSGLLTTVQPPDCSHWRSRVP
jgi:hypothetical protein